MNIASSKDSLPIPLAICPQRDMSMSMPSLTLVASDLTEHFECKSIYINVTDQSCGLRCMFQTCLQSLPFQMQGSTPANVNKGLPPM